MENSCVYKALVNKLLNGEKSTRSKHSYIHSCKLELLSPAVVKQLGSLHDDMLQLCFIVIVSIHHPVWRRLSHWYLLRSCIMQWENKSVPVWNPATVFITFSCSLFTLLEELWVQAEKQKIMHCMCLNTWNSCCVNIAWPEKRAGESLPFGAKWELVPRLQSTASPEASSLRLHWCGH